MRITYLSNSGFALENANELLVFDCHNPKKQAALDANLLQAKKSVTAFISHIHGDHYSTDIWGLPNTRFIAGFDVPVPSPVSALCTNLRPGEQATVNGLHITAYGSTDEGVSFYVQWGETTVFHAGDLNDWHWRDEGGEDYAHKQELLFMQELERIQQNEQPPVLAFFPVDPRMGTDYYRGAILFAQAMRPKYFMPMHFGRQFAPPPSFFEQIAPYTTLLTPPEMGNSIDITN